MAVTGATRTRTKRPQRVASAPVAALASIEAGPDLCAALAALDLSALTGFDMPLVLRACYRQNNYERAQLFDVVAEVMRRKDPEFGADDLCSTDEVGMNEIRAALAMTRRSANSLCGLARDLKTRLPMVFAAMRCGALDQPRARVFSVWTQTLADAHAQAIADRLLPAAPRMTTAELADAIQRAAIDLDPNWARRRYERAVSQRQVRGVLSSEGTGTLSGEGLPAVQVAAACDRLDAIAWHLKRQGHPGKLDHIRADIYIGLLDGSYADLTESRLLAHLLATMPPPGPDGGPSPDAEHMSGPEHAPEPDAERSPEPEPERSPEAEHAPEAEAEHAPEAEAERSPEPQSVKYRAPAESIMDGHGDGRPKESEPPEEDSPGADPPSDPNEPAGGGSGADPGPRRPNGGPAGGRSWAQTWDEEYERARRQLRAAHQEMLRRYLERVRGTTSAETAHAADAALAPGTTARAPDTTANVPVLRRKGLRLWAELGTIAGLDRRSSELLGWGVLHAELARRAAAALGASWWYVLTDDDGTPIDVGPIRRRPTKAWQVAAADFAGSGGPPIGHRDLEVWLQLTRADLDRLAHGPPPGWEELIADIARRVAASPGGAPNGDPWDRLPSGPLRRWLHVRDRRCAFPGCRVAPHRCDADHSREFARGGPTVDANLAAVCGPDHALRHEGGWAVQQVTAGRVLWTSRLGHEYEQFRPALRSDPMPVPTRPEDDWGRPVDEAHDGGRNGESILDRDWWLHTCLRQGPPAPSPAREPEPHPDAEPDHEIEPNYNVEPDHETEPNYNVEPEATTRVAAATTADDEKPPF